jgi:hypothetical protein
MGLMEVIRKAEEQSRRAARRGMERARATWNSTERRLRRKMRVNPPADQMQQHPDVTALKSQPPTRERKRA